MDIHYEIVKLFFNLIIITPIIAIPFKIFISKDWRVSIIMALLIVIMPFLSVFLRRYFGLDYNQDFVTINIRYEIIRMLCLLVVFVSLNVTIVRVFYGRSWKLAIIASLSGGVALLIIDSLCRYFGLY